MSTNTAPGPRYRVGRANLSWVTLREGGLVIARCDSPERARELVKAANCHDALVAALEGFVEGEPWQYLSCHADAPVADCKLCGRYHGALAALAEARRQEQG